LNCNEVRTLLQAYMDDEVDLSTSLEIGKHLENCSTCDREYQSSQALRRAVASGTLYHRAPVELQKRVRSVVRQESRAEAPLRSRPWSLLGVAAGLALVALITWGLLNSQARSSQSNLLAQEVLSSSMRSLIAGPLTDVQSSDQHTVKPWFAGKLDFSPTVQDYATQGFPLAGGRLDYVDNRPVAALVYRHQQHVINLYTWPAPGTAIARPQEHNFQGYNVFSWIQNGMTYWAVSDMDAGELRQFAKLIQDSPGPAPSP
jgi:anti-sigma factor (TIGR02949 family)